MMAKKNILVSALLALVIFTTHAQTGKEQWVDSVFQTLDEDEKIGQLFFARLSSHSDADLLKSFGKMAADGDLGGIIFTTGTPNKQARITTNLQRQARVPLFIAQDASSGLGALLDSALSFPPPLMQGAIPDDTLVYRIARSIGRQLKAIGVHMSLSPNATPIHSGLHRAPILFGDNPANVARKSLVHIKGLRDAGVLSCAKYFPLKGIEVINQQGETRIALHHDSVVSRPYRVLFGNELDAVIPNGADLPLFYENKAGDLKKRLSEETMASFEKGQLLHGAMGYNGIVMVDLRTMTSRDKFVEGDGAVLAFQTGADVIITDEDPGNAIKKIRKLVHAEDRYAAQLDDKVKRVLGMKYNAGLTRAPVIDMTMINPTLAGAEGRVLRSRALRQSVTVIRNQNQALPLSVLENRKFTCVVAGDTSERADIFVRSVRKYVPADRLDFTRKVKVGDLGRADVLLVAIFPNTTNSDIQSLFSVLQSLAAHQVVVVADFGSATFEQAVDRFPSVLTGYADDPDMVGIVPQVIFGGLPGVGTLPVAFGNVPSGTSFPTDDLQRLEYSFPEDAGIDARTLSRISQIADEAIASGSTPGCYVLVAKDGKVVYDQAFGHLTYDRKAPVTDETIYDLASLTKVSATLQAVMFMHEHNLIDIHKKLSVYLPELKGTNKKNITIVDALTHQAGLAPFVPLWPLTLEGPALKPIYYSSQQNVSYPLQIAPRLFGSPILKDSVWSWIATSKMMDKPARTPYSYRYSDLGFMMFKQLSERILNQPLEDFLQQNFYEPLGAYSLGYTPLDRFPAERIAPTELDTLFRGGLLIGTVHDERAAMLGGVSGHAGLFGTANDLSKLGQMLLQEGSYGGSRYYKPETVRLFTQKYYESSRRGLGWDKPVQNEWKSPASLYASSSTFGHTGFTGTCLWVDPEFNLVYIFLSNRVFPDRSDKLIQANIRSRIQDVIYQAVFDYCKSDPDCRF